MPRTRCFRRSATHWVRPDSTARPARARCRPRPRVLPGTDPRRPRGCCTRSPSAQGPDGPDRAAQPRRQPPQPPGLHAPQRRHRQRRSAGQACPAHRPQRRRSGMAGGGKHRRQERQRVPARAARRSSAPLCAELVTNPRTRSGPGQRPPRRCTPARSAAASLASPATTSTSRRARHSRARSRPRASAPRIVVMPQHHPGQAPRQPGDRRPRVGQPARVGEQPQRRNAAGRARAAPPRAPKLSSRGSIMTLTSMTEC